MAVHILQAGWGKGDVSKVGLEKQAPRATHILKAGQGRKCEQDEIGGICTDGNSPSASSVGMKET